MLGCGPGDESVNARAGIAAPPTPAAKAVAAPEQSEPVAPQEESDGATPTPLPTECVEGLRGSEVVQYCGPALPVKQPGTVRDNTLLNLIEAHEQAVGNQERSDDDTSVKTTVIMGVEPDEVSNVRAWLKENGATGIRYDASESATSIWAYTPVSKLRELAQLAGVSNVNAPVTPSVPAH